MRYLQGQGDVMCAPSVNPDHEAIRQRLAQDVERYLGQGGSITKLPPEATGIRFVANMAKGEHHENLKKWKV